MNQAILNFIKTHKGKLKLIPHESWRSVKRSDGGNIPHPPVNFGGHSDLFITGESNTMVVLSVSAYSKAVLELLNWALENYPTTENTDGKEKENQVEV